MDYLIRKVFVLWKITLWITKFGGLFFMEKYLIDYPILKANSIVHFFNDIILLILMTF